MPPDASKPADAGGVTNRADTVFSIEKHDQEDGSINWEVWEYDPNYHRICVINDGETGNPRALDDARRIVDGLRARLAQLPEDAI